MNQSQKGKQHPAVPHQILRIIYIIDNLEFGGTQTALIQLITGLVPYNFSIKVYCLNDRLSQDVVDRMKQQGASVIVIGKFKLMTLWGFLKLYIDFKRWRPHIVQTYLPFSDMIGRIIASWARVPVILSSIRARNTDKSKWQLFLDRITIKKACRIIFNSHHVIPFSIENEGVKQEQVVVIPNGIEIPNLNYKKQNQEIKTELQLMNDDILIGTVGRLRPQKGYPWLLRAFAEIQKNDSRAHLLIIGDGPLDSQLQEETQRLRIQSHVHFLGKRPRAIDLIAGFDIFVLASLWEGMPNVIMEAMALGKPVVATNVDGTQELISHQQTGWLVPPKDHHSLAFWIKHALSNKNEREQIGLAAAKMMQENYSTDKMVRKYHELYQELLQNKQ